MSRGGGTVYECSGLTVVSDIELAAPLAHEVEPLSADVSLILDREVDVPFERPSAEVVAELIVDDFPWYSFCRSDDGFVGRMTGIADFMISADLKRVLCQPMRGGRTHVIPIVVPGTIVAFLLAMGGRFVLHGSAVARGGRAVAFTGASGQGKSTMAALFCAAGAELVTDDVLPLEFESVANGPEVVRCRRSGAEIRLREKAVSLLHRFTTNATIRVTQDDRYAVVPLGRGGQEPLALDAIMLPRPDRENTVVSARRLSEVEASLRLGRCQRIEGWREPQHLRQHFFDVGRVVATVPVFEVWVPWGPPFGDDLPGRILEACGLTGALSLPGHVEPVDGLVEESVETSMDRCHHGSVAVVEDASGRHAAVSRSKGVQA